MKQITDISQLKQGDQIWSIDALSGQLYVLEFLCLHPWKKDQSIFLSISGEPQPCFYNARLTVEKWFIYDASDECRQAYKQHLIEWHQNELAILKA